MIDPRRFAAFLAVLLFANVLFSLRALPGHTRWLWWLGAPCFHGGVMLLGFCYLWILGSRIRGCGTPGRAPAALFLVRPVASDVRSHGSLLTNLTDSLSYIRGNEVFAKVIVTALLNATLAAKCSVPFTAPSTIRFSGFPWFSLP